VEEKVGRDPAGIVPILAEAKVTVGIERTLGCRSEPAVPVDVLGSALRLDAVVPFAEKRVAGGGGLRAQYLPDLSGVNQLFRPVSAGRRKSLIADLQNAVVFLYRLHDSPRLFQVVRHGLFRRA